MYVVHREKSHRETLKAHITGSDFQQGSLSLTIGQSDTNCVFIDNDRCMSVHKFQMNYNSKFQINPVILLMEERIFVINQNGMQSWHSCMVIIGNFSAYSSVPVDYKSKMLWQSSGHTTNIVI